MSGREDVLRGLEGYTRGPWEIVPHDPDHMDAQPVDVAEDKNGGRIVAIEGGLGNARLIARAPALVDEIQALRAAIRREAKYLRTASIDNLRALDTSRRLSALLPDTPEEG